MSMLKSMGFKIAAFYPQDSRSDILGYIDPIPPMDIPTKTLVTVIKGNTTKDKIENLAKFANDSKVTKTIIFSPSTF